MVVVCVDVSSKCGDLSTETLCSKKNTMNIEKKNLCAIRLKNNEIVDDIAKKKYV